jgi:1-phosphatidylinositol-3-phosphate 5-kinase
MQAAGGEVSGGGGKSLNLAAVAAASAAAAAFAAQQKMGKMKGSSVASERQDSLLSGVPRHGIGGDHAAKAKETTTITRRHGTRGSSIMTTTTMSDQAQRPGSSPISESHASTAGSSYLVDTHIRRGKTESILSLISPSEMNVVEDGERGKGTIKGAPAPPPKDKGFVERRPMSAPSIVAMKELPAVPTSSPVIHQPTPSTTSITSAIANSLNMAMRYMLNHPSSDPLPSSPSPFLTHPLPPTPPAVPKKQLQHHSLLLVDLNQTDERPHIKYDWTIGKRLKFSCTVYYAKQFELMRKRCGIDDTFLKSLERSIHWVAEGGKSKSNFWKTMDGKFIIKTLVDAWNVADLYAVLFSSLTLSDERYSQASLIGIGPCLFSICRIYSQSSDDPGKAGGVLYD